MKTLQKLILVGFGIGILIAAVVCWICVSWRIGVAGVLALPAYIFFYKNSEKFYVAKRQRWKKTEWAIFKMKFNFASTSAAIFALGVFLVIEIISASFFGHTLPETPPELPEILK